MNFKQRTAKVFYDPGKTDPEMLVAAVALSKIFEATVLPRQHPAGENMKGPDPSDERIPQNTDQK